MLPPAPGAIRLRDHAAHPMARREKRLQGRNSKLRRTKKYDAEWIYHSPRNESEAVRPALERVTICPSAKAS